MLRLRVYPVIVVPVPNGMYIPARTAAERSVVARIIKQMKASGQLLEGVADLVVLAARGAGCIELKRPEERTLFGRARRGTLSDNQEIFRDRCRAAGVNWAECTSWAEVRAVLIDWGLIDGRP